MDSLIKGMLLMENLWMALDFFSHEFFIQNTWLIKAEKLEIGVMLSMDDAIKMKWNHLWMAPYLLTSVLITFLTILED